MKEEASWLTELKWWLSALTTLMPLLLVFGAIATLGILATTEVGGANDRYGIVIDSALYFPIYVPVVLFPFVGSALLGVRLLVPTFAGMPPRPVAIVMATWPLVLGAALVWTDPLGVLFFGALGVVWALMMPLPRKSLLAGDSIRDAAIVGLAFTALTGLREQGILMAIMWCAWRLYRNKSLEVAVTAACAAVMPVLLIVSELRTPSQGGVTSGFVVEVLILAGLVVAGLVFWRFPRPEREIEEDEYDDDYEEEDETDEV